MAPIAQVVCFNKFCLVNKFCWWLLILLFAAGGCTTSSSPETESNGVQISAHAEDNHQTENIDRTDPNSLPALTPVTLAAGEKLKVVATTNLVADIVAQVAGDQIALYSLMGPAVDPHSYTTTPQDLRTLAEAHVVFINGLQLEAALTDLLGGVTAPLVSVNVGVAPRDLAVEAQGAEKHEEEAHEEEHTAEHSEHRHEGIDPHTWQRVANVKIWVENIQATLSQLDPANADAYSAAADAYRRQLDALDTEIREKVAAIDPVNRKLVTDHETFGYFADEYGFIIVGALIPSLSTAAEPSAQALAALQDQLASEGIKAIFVGTTVNPRLAEQLAQDLEIQVISLYSDSLSTPDGPAATYLDFMRSNVDAIVAALQ